MNHNRIYGNTGTLCIQRVSSVLEIEQVPIEDLHRNAHVQVGNSAIRLTIYLFFYKIIDEKYIYIS